MHELASCFCPYQLYPHDTLCTYGVKQLFSLGFTDFRVRQMGNAAKLQLPDAQLAHIVEAREQIVATLKQWYSTVLLDLEVRDE